MSIVGSGAASGGAQLLPEVLAFSSSLPLDRQLLREDVIGSLAHLIMLSRTGIVPREAAGKIRAALVRVLEERPELPDEEDVHMAVETLLARELGETAGMLHTARSRNDQVALDLRLHVREQCALALAELAGLIGELASRARGGARNAPARLHPPAARPAGQRRPITSAPGAPCSRAIRRRCSRPTSSRSASARWEALRYPSTAKKCASCCASAA